MHIPDGMLDTKTWVGAWAGSAGVLAYASARVRQSMRDERVVLMAVMAALVFALQMLNFPVAGGTSGHFAGGTAVAIVLGPWPAMIVMTAVLAIQALLFADGGVTALGANVVNLAVLGPLVGWLVYRAAVRVLPARVRPLGPAVAAWTSCVAGAVSATVMLWASGRVPLVPALVAMGFWHALIGIGEGVITAGLIGYLTAVRPDLLAESDAGQPRPAGRVVPVLAIVALIAGGLSFLASTRPDGLESVYARLGTPVSTGPLAGSPMPGYLIPGVSNATLGGVLAAVVGVIVTGVIVYALVRGALSRRTGA